MIRRPPRSTLFPYNDALPILDGGLTRRLRQAADDDRRHGMKMHQDRKSTRLNSSHVKSSYAVFCLKKKKPETGSYSYPNAARTTMYNRARYHSFSTRGSGTVR